MPCYNDTPGEDDQLEIEKRCKIRMYFDVQSLMTDEQVAIANAKEISMFPLPDENTALCKLCSILEKEQMEKITAYYFCIKWPHKTLYDWYMKHIEDDKNNE